MFISMPQGKLQKGKDKKKKIKRAWHTRVLAIEVNELWKNHLELRRPKDKENIFHVVQVNNLRRYNFLIFNLDINTTRYSQ